MEISSNRQQGIATATQGAKQGQTKGDMSLAVEGAKAAPSLPATEARSASQVVKIEPADIDAALEELCGFIEGLGRDLSFSRDEGLEKSIITVFDSNTKEVVRQIPSEEVVAIARQIKSDLDELRAGLLINGKA